MNSFKLIKEMVLALDRNKSEMLKDWLYKQSKNQFGRLYKEILTSKVKNDNEAALRLGYKSEQDPAYRKLKTTFKDKLEDLFLYVELKTPKGKLREDYVRANLNKEVAAWHNMALAGANNAYAAKGETLYKKAKEYSFNKISQLVLDHLTMLSEIIGDKDKYKYYNEEKEHVEKTLVVERLGGQYFSKFQKAYKNTKASKVYLFDEYEKDYQNFILESAGLTSMGIIFYQFLLKIHLYSITNSHKIVFETAKEAAAYFEELPIVYGNMSKFFNHYLIEGYAKIKNYEQVEYYALQNLDLLQEGQNSWFKTYELYTFATLHLGYYEKAAELLQFIKDHELYENQQPMLRDNLRFIEAHLYLQYELGEYQPKRKEFQTHYSKKFTFINLTGDLEVSGTDRQGLGIVELLLDIVFDLLRENKNEKISSLKKEVIERLDAIEKYFQRYTDLEGYERLIAYYRLIRLGIKHNWKSSLIEKEALPFYKVLDEEYEIFSIQRFDVEYLPYKDQFISIVTALSKKKY